jgi:hypothetical protein
VQKWLKPKIALEQKRNVFHFVICCTGTVPGPNFGSLTYSEETRDPYNIAGLWINLEDGR